MVQVFSCKFCEISKNTFFTEQLRATASANRKNIYLVKIKDVDLNWQDFCKRGKTVKRLLTAPKKNYSSLVQPQKRPPDFHDFADKLKDIIPGSVLNTAVPKPKFDFVRGTLKHEWNKDCQFDNSRWFLFIKGFITASKSHQVMTKMKKVVSGGGDVVNLWSSFQNVSQISLHFKT